MPSPLHGRAALATAVIAVAAAACILGQYVPARNALLGKGDEWIAKEDSMALDVADEMAKRFVPRSALAPDRERMLPAARRLLFRTVCAAGARRSASLLGCVPCSRSLQRSQHMLHQQVGGRGRSANRGLGGSMQELQEEGKAVKLQLKADNDRAQLERSRAHLLRMRAADDTDIARSSLDKVPNRGCVPDRILRGTGACSHYPQTASAVDSKPAFQQVVSLDKQLALIKHQAQAARAGFGRASKVILASSQAHTKLLEDAARVAAKVKGLRKKITKLVAESHADKLKAAADKDKEDEVQEDLSSALVRRNRREKRVAEERRRLDRLELDDKKADTAAAAKVKAVGSEYKSAQQDLRQLQNKFQKPKGAAVHHQLQQRHAKSKSSSK
jgi:uncharacterized ferredoxin-like protein